MGERMSRGRRTALTAVTGAVLAVILVIVAAAVVYVRGGIAHPADRARTEAEQGYEEWSGPFGEEAAARQAALEPVLGEPIEETWYIMCSGIARGGPVPTAQFCYLSVATTYAVDWTDPHAEVDEIITALEGTEATTGDDVTAGDGGPWTAIPMDPDEEPGGRIAEAGHNGTAYIHEPGFEAIETGEAMGSGLFLDEAIAKQTVPAATPPAGHGQVTIRRQVGLSRTNIGCLPSPSLGCSSLMDEASMPHVDGFS
ncbi:hypothetical protein ACTXO9_01105 [Brachybacterium tyrofermentans]|uniref:hypothetical protein n=1 Tax=Brachybacterium tyrofermentans TaxID=47848 RepID=UPI003FD23548